MVFDQGILPSAAPLDKLIIHNNFSILFNFEILLMLICSIWGELLWLWGFLMTLIIFLSFVIMTVSQLEHVIKIPKLHFLMKLSSNISLCVLFLIDRLWNFVFEHNNKWVGAKIDRQVEGGAVKFDWLARGGGVFELWELIELVEGNSGTHF